jgi:hypothetical protein
MDVPHDALGFRNASRLRTARNTGPLNTHAIGIPFMTASHNLHRKMGHMRRTSSHLTDELGRVLSFAFAECYHRDQWSHSSIEVHVVGTECNLDQGIQRAFSSSNLDPLHQALWELYSVSSGTYPEDYAEREPCEAGPTI